MEVKQSFIKDSNARIDLLSSDIDRLSEMYQEKHLGKRDDLRITVELLREKERLLRSHLDELRFSDDNNWEQLKVGFETVGSELETALKEAISRVPKYESES